MTDSDGELHKLAPARDFPEPADGEEAGYNDGPHRVQRVADGEAQPASADWGAPLAAHHALFPVFRCYFRGITAKKKQQGR